MARILVALMLMVSLVSCTKQQNFPVKYSISFTSTWSAQTHPTDYPQDAHFTPFEVFSHKASTEAYTVGYIATDGIKDMAETGRLTKLEEEIDIFRGGDRALDRASGLSVDYLQTSTVFLGFNDDHSYFTLVSMIGPSPDWFVGLKAVPLKVNGEWVDSLVLTPTVLDAGTDNGISFTSDDNPAIPPNVISTITSQPLADNGVVAPMARVTVVRVK